MQHTKELLRSKVLISVDYENGIFYAYGNESIEVYMRRNSFRKVSQLKKELRYAYKQYINKLMLDIKYLNQKDGNENDYR